MRISLVVALTLLACPAPMPLPDAGASAAIDAGGAVGSDDAGGAVASDGGGVDAGPACTALLCVERVFIHLGYNTATSGVIWGGAPGVAIVGYGGNSYPFRAWWREDAGSWAVADLGGFGDPIGPAVVAPISATEFFVAHTGGVTYVVNAGFDSSASRGGWASMTCPQQATGFGYGMSAAATVSTDEVWLAGWKGAVCKWTRDGDLTSVPTSDGGDDWSALLPLSDGGVLLGNRRGQVRTVGDINATRLFASQVSALFRLGETIWAGSGVFPGEDGGGFMGFTPQAGWTPIDAGMRSVHAIWASSAADVWIGDLNGVVAHFDGTHWEHVTIPGLPAGAQVSVISGRGNQLVVGGSVPEATDEFSDAFAVVLRRQ